MRARLLKMYTSLACVIIILGACAAHPESVGRPRAAGDTPYPSPSTAIAGAPPVQASRRVRMAADIDTYVSRLSADGAFSGVILVVYDGELVIEQGYGWADSERGARNTPTTRFRISSLTKPFTAMAIMLLQQQQRLRVEDAICTYLNPCPAAWQAITIHQLLTHTSGIPDYTQTAGFWERSARQGESVAGLLARIAQLPLVAPPGAQFVYSNSGYVLLGAIIARVAYPDLPAELAYYQFLQTAIFEPLHLTAMGSEACEATVAALAAGYVEQGVRAASCDPSAFYAMGDLYGTARDLYHWGQALDSDRLLLASARTAMIEPYVETSGFQTAYGYGWYRTELGGARNIWHDGATPGYRSFLQRRLGEDTTVIILSNFEVSPVRAMGQEIAAVLIRRSGD